MVAYCCLILLKIINLMLKIIYIQSIRIRTSTAGDLMVVRNDRLRWIGGSLALANLAMFLIWGWGTLFFLGLVFGGVLFAAGWWAEEIDLTNELPLVVSLIGVGPYLVVISFLFLPILKMLAVALSALWVR